MSTSTRTAGSTLRMLLVSSRPLSWVNTAYPFAAAYLITTGGMNHHHMPCNRAE